MAPSSFFRRIGRRPADVGGRPWPNCLIVHHNTYGMRNDALVLGQAIRRHLRGADLFAWEVPLPATRERDGERLATVPAEIAALLPFDFVFFIEHVRPIDRLWDTAFARKRVLVPNLEWLTELDEELVLERGVDAMLLKNPFAARAAEPHDFARAIPLSRVVGWTSLDLMQGTSPSEPNFDLALHTRGQSRQKQTNLVLKVWHEQPHFPLLSLFGTAEDGMRFPAPAMIGGNIRVTFGEMAEDAMRAVQRAMGVHVFPSAAEGFGHALNEARAAGAILVTTDAEPMRDLVEDGVSGILVRTRAENRFRLARSIAVKVLEEDLAAAVERVLAMSGEQRRAMGKAARAAFVADRAKFHGALAEVVRELR